VSRETERFVEMAAMIGKRLGDAMEDVVPAEAHAHLVNAQRELLTALFLIYEHQVGARRETAPQAASRRRSGSRTARKQRVQRIEID
jgi:hypothetical protein